MQSFIWWYRDHRQIKRHKQCPPCKWDHLYSLLHLASLPSSSWHPLYGTGFTGLVHIISWHRTCHTQYSHHMPPAVLDSNALSTLNFLKYFGRLNLSPISGLTHWARCRTALQSEEERTLLLLLSSGAGSSSSLEMLIILATFCGGVSEKTANGWWGSQQRRGNSPHFAHLCLFMLNLKNLLGRVGPESWLQNCLFGKYN